MPSDFGEQDHNDTILQQDGAERLRIFTLHFGTSSIESFHANELAEASLALGHFAPLTLHHLILSAGGT